MKFCPYCGVVLKDNAAPFCSECGHALPSEGPIPAGNIRQTEPKRRKTVRTQPDRPPKAPGPKKQRKRRKTNFQTEQPSILDDGYDGYYNDILPEDEGEIKDGLEPGLVKRIVLVATGVLVVIALAVLAMYFL
jgi:hypothetical protein